MCRLTIDYCQSINIPPHVSETASSLITGALWGKLLRNYQVIIILGNIMVYGVMCYVM